MTDKTVTLSSDPTADAEIDIGQRWKDRQTGDRFTVLRTYRDNPINPSFLVKYEVPDDDPRRVLRTVTLVFFDKWCERVESSS